MLGIQLNSHITTTYHATQEDFQKAIKEAEIHSEIPHDHDEDGTAILRFQKMLYADEIKEASEYLERVKSCHLRISNVEPKHHHSQSFSTAIKSLAECDKVLYKTLLKMFTAQVTTLSWEKIKV